MQFNECDINNYRSILLGDKVMQMYDKLKYFRREINEDITFRINDIWLKCKTFGILCDKKIS